MKKINCIVIDDEPLGREGNEQLIAEIPFFKLIGSYESVADALPIISNSKPDLIFLDINMPGINGVDFLKFLNANNRQIEVVFITAHREFALDGFELKAADYLLKPVALQRFKQMANEVYKRFTAEIGTENKSYFFIKEEGRITKINFSNILFVEGLKDYIFIHTTEKRHITLLSLKMVEDNLPSDDFVRVHRSFIVNKNKIESLEGNRLFIQNREIPIGKTLKEGVLQKIVGDNLWKRGGSE